MNVQPLAYGSDERPSARRAICRCTPMSYSLLTCARSRRGGSTRAAARARRARRSAGGTHPRVGQNFFPPRTRPRRQEWGALSPRSRRSTLDSRRTHALGRRRHVLRLELGHRRLVLAAVELVGVPARRAPAARALRRRARVVERGEHAAAARLVHGEHALARPFGGRRRALRRAPRPRMSSPR
jgi:hypothetical protein